LRRAWLNSFPQRVAAGVRSDQIGYSEYSGRIRTCVASPRLTSPRPASPRLVEGHYLLPASVPDGRPAIQIPPPAHQDLWIYVHFDKAAIKRWQAPPLRRPQRVMRHVSLPASGCISPSIIEHPLRAGLILASERSNYWEALSLHIACFPILTMDRESRPASSALARRFFRGIPFPLPFPYNFVENGQLVQSAVESVALVHATGNGDHYANYASFSGFVAIYVGAD